MSEVLSEWVSGWSPFSCCLQPLQYCRREGPTSRDKKAAHPLRQTGRGLKPGRRAWPGFDLSAPEACGKRMGPEG